MVFLDFVSNPSIVGGFGYGILFILMIFEGPIVTTIAAFLSSLGLFNVYAILAISGFGNIVGDIIWYSVGRSSRKSIIEKRLKKRKLGKEIIKKIEKILQENSFKALFIIKFIPPLPLPGLMLAGATKMDVKKFLFGSIIISFLYSGIFTAGGYFIGIAFANNFISATKYLGYILLTIFLILFIIWINKNRKNN